MDEIVTPKGEGITMTAPTCADCMIIYGSSYGQGTRLELCRKHEATDDLLAALVEIEKGEGAFSCDPFTHAMNAIEHMQDIARAAIAKATGG